MVKSTLTYAHTRQGWVLPVVVFVLAFGCCEGNADARFVVAERGAPPRTTIWCSDAGVEVEKHAANELRDSVRRITGVELPVSLESKRPSGRVIQLSSGEFEDDGFELAVKGETLRIRGGRRAGVLYGVYELLESYGGCGWFASGTEVVPEADAFCVPGDLRDRQVPDFVQRDTCATDVMYNPAFAAKLRYNGNLSCRASTPELGGVSDFLYCKELPNCHTFMRRSGNWRDRCRCRRCRMRQASRWQSEPL